MVQPLSGAMEKKYLSEVRTLTCGREVVPAEVLNPTAVDTFPYKVALPVDEAMGLETEWFKIPSF